MTSKLKVYTRAEVTKHKTDEDLWMIIWGKVYNVSGFLFGHPGGPNVLMDYAGKDATRAFEGLHSHSAVARKEMEEFLVGELPPEEKTDGKTPIAAKPEEKEKPKEAETAPSESKQFPSRLFTVSKIERIALRSFVLTFKPSISEGESKEGLVLGPGQHVSVCFLTAKQGQQSVVERPYTPISNADGSFELCVKRYDKGAASRFLTSLSVGAHVVFKGPKQTFSFDAVQKGTYSQIIMVAGGTGITPMYQLLPFLAKLAASGTQPRVRMVFANHSVEDILLRDELDEFAAKHSSWFSLQYAITESPGPAKAAAPKHKTPADAIRGHISAAVLRTAFKDTLAASGKHLALVCGTESFNTDCVGMLRAMGFDMSNESRKIFVFA